MDVAPVSAISKTQHTSSGGIGYLPQLLICCSLLNLLVVALIGVVLRSYPFYSFPFEYKNLLHGHSHFAFGGWVMPALLGLLLKNFPQLQRQVAYRHWRNIGFLLLLSAYGMLVAFPLQGYKLASIFFSALSVLAGFYLAAVVWKALPFLKQSIALRFLKAGLFYLLLSSIGPFATGPLAAMGKAGTTLYVDAIYFYLHFQYNGWFLFGVLALFYQYAEQVRTKTNSSLVFLLMNIACAPSFFLSVLWHEPPLAFHIIGGMAALLACVALFCLLQDLLRARLPNKLVRAILHLSFASLVVKTILQLFSALPAVAVLAYQQRNFVIAYLHLALLGFISLFLIGWIIHSSQVFVTKVMNLGLVLFVFAFVATELVLIALPVTVIKKVAFTQYALLLLLLSILFPVSILFIASPFFPGTNKPFNVFTNSAR